VVRASVAEVEDYARVALAAVPDSALLGRAVADVTHLLAELIENATVYSPPHTLVRISGHTFRQNHSRAWMFGPKSSRPQNTAVRSRRGS